MRFLNGQCKEKQLKRFTFPRKCCIITLYNKVCDYDLE
jgi:hypothetical protein